MEQNSLDITYNGYFVPLGGYGILNWQWAKHLARAGVNVTIKTFFPIEQYLDQLTPEESLLYHKTASVTPRIGIVETQPWSLDWVKNEVKIVSAMVESSAIGGVWIKTLNQADQIVVPNEFCRKVLEKYDVKTPITVIPPGVDTKVWSYIQRPYRNVFTFGMCGYLDKRKGALEVIQAFCSEFSGEKDVQLVLHSSNSDFGFYRSIQDPRITITTRFKSTDELHGFYGMLDCFVFPSRGEGIGYPPREAMSTGLPVIGMAWSGMEEIMLSEISYPIHPSGFSSRNDMVEQPGNWADIDVSELMYQMRNVYEHQDQAKEKGVQAADFIRKNFSWKQSTDRMIQFLKDL